MDSTHIQANNLEFLRKSAKSLLKEIKCDSKAAVERLRRFKVIKPEEAKLADAQFVLAQENGFSSWSKMKEALSSPNIQNAIKNIREGKAVILFDDEGRENEGDFVIAAEKVNGDHINFITKYGRGTVCVAISQRIATRLSLTPTKTAVAGLDVPNFAQPIDGVGTNTGISASERAATTNLIADETSTESNFRTPGHIATLIEHEGGINKRKGHTEGSIRLMRLAGLQPAALICEILNDDGSMARKSVLISVSKKREIPLISISEL